MVFYYVFHFFSCCPNIIPRDEKASSHFMEIPHFFRIHLDPVVVFFVISSSFASGLVSSISILMTPVGLVMALCTLTSLPLISHTETGPSYRKPNSHNNCSYRHPALCAYSEWPGHFSVINHACPFRIPRLSAVLRLSIACLPSCRRAFVALLPLCFSFRFDSSSVIFKLVFNVLLCPCPSLKLWMI